jgi:hypothetical protein
MSVRRHHGYARDGGAELSPQEEHLINVLIAERNFARSDKDFSAADAIRARLRNEHGVELFDGVRKWRRVGGWAASVSQATQSAPLPLPRLDSGGSFPALPVAADAEERQQHPDLLAWKRTHQVRGQRRPQQQGASGVSGSSTREADGAPAGLPADFFSDSGSSSGHISLVRQHSAGERERSARAQQERARAECELESLASDLDATRAAIEAEEATAGSTFSEYQQQQQQQGQQQGRQQAGSDQLLADAQQQLDEAARYPPAPHTAPHSGSLARELHCSPWGLCELIALGWGGGSTACLGRRRAALPPGLLPAEQQPPPPPPPAATQSSHGGYHSDYGQPVAPAPLHYAPPQPVRMASTGSPVFSKLLLF